MLTLKLEEIEKLISTLKWVQVATLSTDTDRKATQRLIEKFIVAKKTAARSQVEIIVE